MTGGPRLTPKQMNTDFAQELKSVFKLTLTERPKLGQLQNRLKALEGAFPASPNEPDPKHEKKKGKGAKGGHAADGAQAIAVLAKDGKYARRGARYINEQGGRGVYNVFSHLAQFKGLTPDLRAEVENAARFPGGPKSNFNVNVGLKYPYAWRAHHIIPGSAFYYEREDGPVFTLKQYLILLQTPYDINHGHNIIMLPYEMWAVAVHALIQHPSDHPTYTQDVMATLQQISKTIKSLMADRTHDEVVADFASELRGAEDDLWDAIVQVGRDATAALFLNKRFDHPWVSHATAGGKEQVALR